MKTSTDLEAPKEQSVPQIPCHDNETNYRTRRTVVISILVILVAIVLTILIVLATDNDDSGGDSCNETYNVTLAIYNNLPEIQVAPGLTITLGATSFSHVWE